MTFLDFLWLKWRYAIEQKQWQRALYIAQIIKTFQTGESK
jgi:hypothetical protein